MSTGLEDEEHPHRRTQPTVTIDDPNDWQKLQRLREIAASKEKYKDSIATAREFQSSNHPRMGEAIMLAHGALVDYIHELLPSIEKAFDNDSMELAYDYWNGVYLGRLSIPEPPFEIDLTPEKIGGKREVTEIRAEVDAGEFVGLSSVVNSPSIVPVECVYKTHINNSKVRDSIVQEYIIPINVLQRAGMFIELFRDEVGLDLEFATPERDDRNNPPA